MGSGQRASQGAFLALPDSGPEPSRSVHRSTPPHVQAGQLLKIVFREFWFGSAGLYFLPAAGSLTRWLKLSSSEGTQ